MTTEIRTRTVEYTVAVQHAGDPAGGVAPHTTRETRFRVESYEVDVADPADLIPPNARLLSVAEYEDSNGDGSFDAADKQLAAQSYEGTGITAGADGSFTDDVPLGSVLGEIVPTDSRTSTDFPVIGAGDPLSTAELDAQIAAWNASYVPVIPDPNIYGTQYVTAEVYNSFGDNHFYNPATDTYLGRDAALVALGLDISATTADITAAGYQSESFEGYVQRHADATNKMIAAANVRLDALVTQYGLDAADYPHLGELVIRRVVVVENTPDASEIHRTPDDSFGDYTLRDTYSTWSNTAMGGGDSPELDEGLIHEWGHRFFLLPDRYALNTTGDPVATDAELDDVPAELRVHNAGDSLMHHNSLLLSDYEILRLSSDIATYGTVDTPRGNYRYPETQLPAQFAVVLPDGVASIEVFHTTHVDANNYEQNLEVPAIVRADKPAAGDFVVAQPFLLGTTDHAGDPMAGDSQGVIGVRLMMNDGTVQMRWLDATQVSTGYLLGFETPRLEFEWGQAGTDVTTPAYGEIAYSDGA